MSEEAPKEVAFTLELRNLAKNTHDKDLRKCLREAADWVETSIKELNELPSFERMRVVNCTWSYAHRIFEAAKVPVDGGPSGGAQPLIQEQLAA